jgi:hypothetical protein
MEEKIIISALSPSHGKFAKKGEKWGKRQVIVEVSRRSLHLS